MHMISIKKHLYFMEIAKVTSTMSTCCRAQVWCVVVKDWMILGTWYNWNARWERHCNEWWCYMIDWHCTAIHSEENAIINCAYNWVSTKWATIYCTHIPCDRCMRRLINAWIEEVYYLHEYRSDEKKFVPNNMISVKNFDSFTSFNKK